MRPHPFTTQFLQVRRNEELLREVARSQMTAEPFGSQSSTSYASRIRAFASGWQNLLSTVGARIRWLRRLANA